MSYNKVRNKIDTRSNNINILFLYTLQVITVRLYCIRLLVCSGRVELSRKNFRPSNAAAAVWKYNILLITVLVSKR